MSYFPNITDLTDIYINGIKEVDDGSFSQSVSDISFMQIRSGYTGRSGSFYFDAVGFSWDTNYTIGSNYLYEPIPLNSSTTHVISIPQIGIVYDADLTFELESIGETQGSGDIIIQLYKNPLNQTLDNINLYNDVVSYESQTEFTHSNTVNLEGLLNLELINDYYGEYWLTISLNGTNSNDRFNLTKLEIETDTFIQAEFGDTEAWITDPALNDTDGDGWDDYEEIFTEGTSPVNVDSDGDDSWDPNDRDPLRDIMLEIELIKGICANLFVGEGHALMQIAVALEFGENEYYVISPLTMATEHPNYPWGQYQRAYFDECYYINIDDDMIRQGTTISIQLQLWLIRRYDGSPDFEAINVDKDYDITEVGQPASTLYESEIGFYGFYDEVEVDVKTVGLEKSNTLALYEANSTFTGHYQDINQRYAVIQLHIPDEGHYIGSESFLNDQVGNCSTEIGFITSDSSGKESCTEIIEEIDGHTKVLRVQETSDDKHTNFYHQFDSSKNSGTIEWWWQTSKISGGRLYFYIRDGTNDVIRLFMRDGKIKYHDGIFHDVMSASSDTWYHMKLSFACKIGMEEVYEFQLYVNGEQKVTDGEFYSNRDSIDNIWISTMADPFSAYFDAFGYTWDSNYDVGDNTDTYDCDGTPFEHGVNVIIIPTERFTETILHRYLENGTLDDTALYHSDKYVFEFISNDRDGTIDEANSDVDFFFMRRNISPEDAMKVLELVLKGLLNESVDESNNTIYKIGWINDYVSTKLNGTKATEMNLPYSVLGYIPWFNTYQSSKMGPEPEPNGGFNLILWLLCMSNPILNNALAMAAVMTGGEIFAYLKEYCENVFMNVLTAVGDLMWTLIRASILVLAYILIAFAIIGIILQYVGLVLIAPLILLLGGKTNFGFNFIEFTLNNVKLIYCTNIIWEFDDFFELELPILVEKHYINSSIVSYTKEGFVTSKFESKESNFTSEIPISSLYERILQSEDEQTSLESQNVQITESTNGKYSCVFTVIYTNLKNNPPPNSIKLYTTCSSWAPSEERTYTLYEADINDVDYTDGKEYIFEIEYDEIGTYKYYFRLDLGTEELITETLTFEIGGSMNDFINQIVTCTILMLTIASSAILVFKNLGRIKNKYLESFISLSTLGLLTFLLFFQYTLILNAYTDDASTGIILGCAIGAVLSSVLISIFSGKQFFSKEDVNSQIFTVLKIIVILVSVVMTSANLILLMNDQKYTDTLVLTLSVVFTLFNVVLSLIESVAYVKGKKSRKPPSSVEEITKYALSSTGIIFGAIGILYFLIPLFKIKS